MEFLREFSKITPRIPRNVFKITSYFELMVQTSRSELNTAKASKAHNIYLFRLFVCARFVWSIRCVLLQVNTRPNTTD